MLLRECKLGSYYEDGKGCVDPTSEPFMQGLSVSGSGRVGDVCQYNTDCLGGMYCSGGLCTCLSTYIMREYYCYEKETHVARETRDGWVCVSLKDSSTGATVPLYFVCPLPEGAGFKIALNDPNPVLGSLPVGCTVGSSATVEPVVGLHGGGSCIWPSEGEYVGDIYDCIHTSPHVNLATKFPLSSYAPSADGVCCPSRGP
ncbi:hypothetical protein NECAME_02512 [Necator americanus]|uniref:EB module n=1 Tax=Necator americanus TaxID=51031 RepID=W2TDW8_NECAM|nr:hypothetical protein NECAME_02512 [Necator americanus]ETN80033.1 hypothetical protein NECAME_02512 [Necator americanus]